MSDQTVQEIRERLNGLAEIISTRVTVERNADDSAAPHYRVAVPTRELDATIITMRQASDLITHLTAEGQALREERDQFKALAEYRWDTILRLTAEKQLGK